MHIIDEWWGCILTNNVVCTCGHRHARVASAQILQNASTETLVAIRAAPQTNSACRDVGFVHITVAHMVK